MTFRAANHLAKVENHASELEKIAAGMEADGIGGDRHRGHVAILRDMAGDLRANAARGVLPSAFSHLYAVGDVAGVHASSANKSSAEAVDAALSSVAGMNANIRRAVVDALTSKGVVHARSEFNGNGGRQTIAKLAANASNTSRLKLIKAMAARLGVKLDDNQPVDLVELDAQLKNKDLEARWQLKSAMRQIGLLS